MTRQYAAGTPPLLVALSVAAVLYIVGMQPSSALSTNNDDGSDIAVLRVIDTKLHPFAVNLDGSPASYYYSPSNSPRPSFLTWWQGGGLCSSPKTCFERSLTTLGTSTLFPPTIPASSFSGVLSRNCTKNFFTCGFSLVHVNYGSGDLYSGTAIDPTVYVDSNNASHTIFFRGDYIRKAIMADVATLMNSQGSTELIYGGGSAGGIATFAFAHVDIPYLQNAVPTLTKVMAMPSSGFFPAAPNVFNQTVGMQGVLEMLKMSGGVASLNPECTKDFAGPLKGMCIQAQFNYKYTTVPTFMLQSHMDEWATDCTLLAVVGSNSEGLECAGAPGWAGTGCPPAWSMAPFPASAPPLERCSSTQAEPLIKFQGNWHDLINSGTIAGFARKYNSFLIDSCFSHVASIYDFYWNGGMQVRGRSMASYAQQWFVNLPQGNLNALNVNSGRGAVNAGVTDCYRSQADASTGYECNPTCLTPSTGSRTQQQQQLSKEHSWLTEPTVHLGLSDRLV